MNELQRPNLPHSSVEHMNKRIQELKQLAFVYLNIRKTGVLYNYFLNIIV